MEHLKYWSRETNPETGAAFEHFRLYMDCTQNGMLDADALLATPFGERLTEYLERRFLFEQLDPMCDQILAYYDGIGIRKQIFEREDFFRRWALFTPAVLEDNRRYPLVIWNHGGKETIEDEEYITDLVPLAAKEKFMVLMAQDTGWERNAELIEHVAELLPLDRERVYMGGFSQGSRLAGAAQLRMPEKLAAVALNGGPVFDTTDNHCVPYTITEIENLSAWFVPFLQIENRCDVSNLAPLNRWTPRKQTPHVDNHYYVNPAYDLLADPTYNHDGVTRERIVPPARGDAGRWLMNLLNLRMAVQGCAFRDAERCLDYARTPEDELHHAVGFYGDDERIALLLGVKHYMVDIFNREGIDAFRYIVVDNTNHWPPVNLGALIWDFFRRFRRDSGTGNIIEDEYQ